MRCTPAARPNWSEHCAGPWLARVLRRSLGDSVCAGSVEHVSTIVILCCFTAHCERFTTFGSSIDFVVAVAFSRVALGTGTIYSGQW